MARAARPTNAQAESCRGANLKKTACQSSSRKTNLECWRAYGSTPGKGNFASRVKGGVEEMQGQLPGHSQTMIGVFKHLQ